MKTRALAASLVEGGGVRLNRAKILKPGHAVIAGDVLTIAIGSHIRILKVLAFAERRGPAPTARLLYQDLAMSNSDGAWSQKEDAMGGETC